jgi:hypothetical protein
MPVLGPQKSHVIILYMHSITKEGILVIMCHKSRFRHIVRLSHKCAKELRESVTGINRRTLLKYIVPLLTIWMTN